MTPLGLDKHGVKYSFSEACSDMSQSLLMGEDVRRQLQCGNTHPSTYQTASATRGGLYYKETMTQIRP